MKLFDTHCHFESAAPEDILPVLRRAKEAGVDSLVAVGGSASLNAAAANAAVFASDRDDLPQVGCAVGFDRDQVGKIQPPLPSVSPVAWGEIGLDYHYSPETRPAQLELFAEQLEEARKRDLPVIIHTREADDDTIALLKEVPSRGIIHCYTGGPAAARAFLDAGFYISFSGIVTFRLADNVRESASVVPDERILIETDSPFLAPVPLRGKKNEPAFIRHTCEFLAEKRGMAAEDFAALTYANAERAFS